MIQFSEIRPNDVIKVRAKDEHDLEDDYYALVTDNFGDILSVRYYCDTSKIYKGAPLYILQDEEDPVKNESITEHYINNTSPFLTKDEFYYMEDEIMSECNSEIEDLSDSESECGSEMDDFIVDDDDVDGEDMGPPPDAESIDREWGAWQPTLPGQSMFKKVVDRLEERARVIADNNRF